jgi:hypothetical protein
MMVIVEQLVEWRLAGETEVLKRKPAPASLCPPQIPHDQTQAWTWATVVGSQLLTAWAMARPICPLLCNDSTASDTHATIEELWETVFSMWSVPRLYSEHYWGVCCEMVASWQKCKHESRRVIIFGNRNWATTNEDYNRLREHVL